MRRILIGITFASLAALWPALASAQCEGGTTGAGYYVSGSVYVPGQCVTTNLTTPGQLYPSGAAPAPSTNPSLGVSRLPGQLYPTGPAPTGGTDLSPSQPSPSLLPGSATSFNAPGAVPGTGVLPGTMSSTTT